MSASERIDTVSVSGSVVSVQVGHVAPLGPRHVPSAFVKRPIAGAVMAKQLGLVGDQQADLRVHGGPDKAVYCYPVEHYVKWLKERPSNEALLMPGGFGENLTTRGLDEDLVCIGDVLRFSGVTAQVTQPRQPCFKLGLRFQDQRMLREMLRSGRSGWYLRVLEVGLVEAGASITIIGRPNPSWSVARLKHLFGSHVTVEELAELAELPGLAAGIRDSARAAVNAASGANRRALPQTESE
jgi:MOSC domain-containing protein YiiM